MAFYQSRPEDPPVQPVDYSFAPHDTVSFADSSVGSPESTGHSSESSDAEIRQNWSELAPPAFSPKTEAAENIEPNTSSSPVLQPVQIPGSEYPELTAGHPVSPAEPAHLQYQHNFFYEHAQNHFYQHFQNQQLPAAISPPELQQQQQPMLPVQQPTTAEEPPVKRRRTDNNRKFFIKRK